MTMTWEARLFFWQAAAIVIFIGWLWKNRRPKWKSHWGLRFRVAMNSEAAWRTLHERAGLFLIGLGVFIAIPFPLVWTMAVQLPLVIVVPPAVIYVIKRSVES